MAPGAVDTFSHSHKFLRCLLWIELAITSLQLVTDNAGPLPGPCCHRHRDVHWQDYCYRLHFFEHMGFNVWGLTAAIMITAARLALGRAPAFEEHGPHCLPYSKLYYDGSRLRLREEQVHVRADAEQLKELSTSGEAAAEAVGHGN